MKNFSMYAKNGNNKNFIYADKKSIMKLDDLEKFSQPKIKKGKFSINFDWFCLIQWNIVISDSVASLLSSLNDRPKRDTLTMTAAIKKHYRENFSDWYIKFKLFWIIFVY